MTKPLPTVEDHLRHAAAATDPAERARRLLLAEAAAAHPMQFLAIAVAWHDAGDRGEADRCIAAALQREGDGAWVHEQAARIYCQHLGDDDAARRTLRALEERLADPSAHAWLVLASAYARILRDPAAARRCLEVLRGTRSSAAELCGIANGYLRLLGDRDAARELLLRAEVLAGDAVDGRGRPDLQPSLAIADAWRVAGEIDRARTMLRAALDVAADVSSCSRVAQEWTRHAKTLAPIADDVRACLERARSLAAWFGDWMAVAEDVHRCAHDPEGLLDCLRQAAALATSTRERREVGRALRDWALRVDEAAAYGPFDCRPDELVAPGPSPLGWQRDAAALFDWLRDRLDDVALAAIARCAIGKASDEPFAALLGIVRSGSIPRPLTEPAEVVSRFHCQSGEFVDQRARAFCCTLLCLDALDDSGRFVVTYTFAVLIESCAMLGNEALRLVPGLLCAFLDEAAVHYAETLTFAALGLLTTAVLLDPNDPRLEDTASRLLVHEAAASQIGYAHPEHGFVLGVTHEDVGVWRRLVDDALALLPTPTPGSALARVVAEFAR